MTNNDDRQTPLNHICVRDYQFGGSPAGNFKSLMPSYCQSQFGHHFFSLSPGTMLVRDENTFKVYSYTWDT